MVYNLLITSHAEELLDNILFYIMYNLKNEQAAVHLITEIENVYKRLEENPYQFPLCNDPGLEEKDYREAIVSKLKYILIFQIRESTVYVLGFFHELEDYITKI